MLSYILLFALIAIVILGVIRASKHRQPGGTTRHHQREPFINTAQDEDEIADGMEMVGKPRIVSRAATPAPKPTMMQEEIEEEFEDDVVILKQPRTAQRAQFITTTDATPLVATKPETKPAAQNNLNDVIALHIIAPDHLPYRGYELLQALLSAGLRYGKWNIFHRHEEITGRGAILFSLASSVEPGVFDLAKMGSFSTPGLTLFMRISGVENPALTFEKLLTAARQLTEELGGTICDEKRFPLTPEKLASWRSQL